MHVLEVRNDELMDSITRQAAERIALYGSATGRAIDVEVIAAYQQVAADRAGITEDAVLLFSESNSRFLVEVTPANWPQFAAHFEGLPLVQLGKVTGGSNVTVRGSAGSPVIDAPWADLKQSWKSPLAWE